MSANNRLIFPLDVPTADEAIGLIDLLAPEVRLYKVGFELIHNDEAGRVSSHLRNLGLDEFRDGKLKDTPDTMVGAVKGLASRGIFALNMHVDCDVYAEDVRLVANVKGKSKLWCVTLLTSIDKEKCHERYGKSHEEVVLERARRAVEGGADGLICSPLEVSALRRAGITVDLVTPGIRPEGAEAGQQKRLTTPRGAILAGSDYLVCGSPIRKAKDPLAAAHTINVEIAEAVAELGF